MDEGVVAEVPLTSGTAAHLYVIKGGEEGARGGRGGSLVGRHSPLITLNSLTGCCDNIALWGIEHVGVSS